MTRYDLESKSKDLRDISEDVKQLSQKIKTYNNLIALDASSSPDKSEVLSLFNTISSAIKPFEYEDDRDIAFWAEVIAEEMQEARDYFVEDYLTDFEINNYVESVSKNIEKILANLRAEAFNPQHRSYDHSEVKEARHA